MNGPLQIAVDLGAGSGRVFLGGVETGELFLEEVRRFHYPPGPSVGCLRWDFASILEEIKAGARQAGERARAMGRPVHSIGVDGWGVDYGLIDSRGRILEDPVCYRDERTRGVMDATFARVPREEIFSRTGIQFLEFNTLYQLQAHSAAGLPEGAAQLLLIPDLVHFCLSGRAVTEYTNATTTQLVSARTKTWDRAMVDRLELPGHLLTEIVRAGTDLGPLAPGVAEELDLRGVRVVTPATHDTGSAIAGAPLEADWAYVSSGTWSLAGVERDSVLIDSDVAGHNFSNEGGAFGTIRFLKNVMGLWILDACRAEWQRRGHDVRYESLLREVAVTKGVSGLIFPDDRRFFNPPSMLDAIASQLAETGQRPPNGPAAVAKIILDSLALRYASVIRIAAALTRRRVRGLQIVGGGSRNQYLNQATATVTGLPVRAGPVEATVTGNVLAQAIARGRFDSLAAARRHLADNLNPVEFAPQPSATWDEAARQYEAIERRYLAAAAA
jgi:rhamnulokinase